MKLTKETLTIIKNYAGINSNLLIKQGSTLSTVSVAKTIMSTVTVSEVFPNEFGIYDVNEFLGALSLFDDPDLEFDSKYVTIKEGKNAIKYFGAAVNNMVVPTKEIIFPEAEIKLSLDASTLAMIMKTAPILKSEDVSFVGNGSTISVNVADKKNLSGNSFIHELGTTNLDFKVNLKMMNLKMLPGDYNVSISSKKISKFSAVNSNLVYYVAVEADSTFEV
jgi:hypothetical protein